MFIALRGFCVLIYAYTLPHLVLIFLIGAIGGLPATQDWVSTCRGRGGPQKGLDQAIYVW